MHKNPATGTGEQNTYAFSYDKLSRLIDTKQFINDQRDDMFVERFMNYDLNGNILFMDRRGFGNSVDVFDYIYDGSNKLQAIESDDRRYEYSYDCNGNMTADGAKAGVTTGDGLGGFEYLGSLVYKRNNGELELEGTGFGGGRIYAASGGSEVYYH